MFESSIAEVAGFDPDLDDAARFERIHRLEQLKAVVAAAQAAEVAAFVMSRRQVALDDIASTPRPGVGRRRRVAEAERGIVSDVALARRESPAQASRFIAFATTGARDLPEAFALLAAGNVCERRVQALHQATAWLTADQRRTVDADLAAELPGLGDQQVHTRAQAAAQQIDPDGACVRVARANKDRHVSLRPAPESMTRLSALLPLVDGVAVWAALNQAAQSARAAGDERGRGQVMADTLVERVTGQAGAKAVPVTVNLVMTDRTLRGDTDEAVRVVGMGTLPGPLARDLILDPGNTDTDSAAQVAVRRLFTDRAGKLVAMESATRLFTPAMAEFVKLRDDTCRTPWCDAPIRHTDHIHPAARGGPTSLANARGLCERCNLAAQAPRLDQPTPLHEAAFPIDIVWSPHAA